MCCEGKLCITFHSKLESLFHRIYTIVWLDLNVAYHLDNGILHLSKDKDIFNRIFELSYSKLYQKYIFRILKLLCPI